jgi:hypothetical protein
MKKILFFLIIGSFLTLTANAQQNCHWAKTAGSSLDDAIYKITGDNSGNVLLALSFQDTVIFGTDSAFSNGGLDGLIVKLNAAGNMVWGQQIAGSGNIVVSGIATDAQDNVYITGYFYGTAYFGTSISHQSMGLADLYVAKISSTGSWQWVKTNGDALAQLGRDIAVTPWGDVVVGGEFGGKLYFNTDSVVATTPDNGFVALLNGNNGNWKWIKRIAGSSSVNSVDAHISSKIVLGGTFSGTAVFGSTNLNASGGTDGFIAVIDSTGLYQWAVKAGGTSADSTVSDNSVLTCFQVQAVRTCLCQCSRQPEPGNGLFVPAESEMMLPAPSVLMPTGLRFWAALLKELPPLEPPTLPLPAVKIFSSVGWIQQAHGNGHTDKVGPEKLVFRLFM